ncbi:hypothetical protein PILCRDRAFT_821418 [Piloderma croceum F 1598]|uniref:Uncharacterized protein n=1 Tax=Piloderma croceum (strain F 1598) TaxID=765440 RepID=A0A0C3FRB7_PILCF|nr:hypothetical protein PILCRDRAFT_821418 [Piloderma croceum F 1598]
MYLYEIESERNTIKKALAFPHPRGRNICLQRSQLSIKSDTRRSLAENNRRYS